MLEERFTFFDAILIFIAVMGSIVWLHIPSVYLRAIGGTGNSFSVVGLYESIWWMRMMPSIYDNSLTNSLPFLHKEIDMCKLFLILVPIGYVGNFAYAVYEDGRSNAKGVLMCLAAPVVPFPGIIVLPYLGLAFILLIIFQVLMTPITLTNIFVMGDTLHGITVAVFLGIIGFTVLALKLDDG